MVTTEGSVRIDLLGGTLDLDGIKDWIPGAMTLNMATSLSAKISIEASDNNQIKIVSKDYASEASFPIADFARSNLNDDKHFGVFKYAAHIITFFAPFDKGLVIEMQSDSPPGAGLGGSSALGITLFKALAQYFSQSYTKSQCADYVKALEAQHLRCGPTGYQDYIPALYGGLLAILPSAKGFIIEQLLSDKLADELMARLTLVYSGKTRLSGINNWEVYKAFVDGDEKVEKGLTDVAELTQKAYAKIKNSDVSGFAQLIKEEGKLRATLFSNIETDEMKELVVKAKNIDPNIGAKVCGAGGGGCFLLIHEPQFRKKIHELIVSENMQVLPFKIQAPLP